MTAGSWGMDARGDVDANLANWLVLVLFVMARTVLLLVRHAMRYWCSCSCLEPKKSKGYGSLYLFYNWMVLCKRLLRLPSSHFNTFQYILIETKSKIG